MKSPWLRRLWALALGTLMASSVFAQKPEITVEGEPPWTNFSVENSDWIILGFERDHTLDTTDIPLDLPSPGGEFKFTKNGELCRPGFPEDCSKKDPGSLVTDPNTIGDDIQVLATEMESDGTFAFTAKIQSTLGDWTTEGSPTPESIQWVWAVPYIELHCPEVAVFASGTLDASESRSTYEPKASAPQLTFKWTPLLGAPAVKTNLVPPHKIARFDPPFAFWDKVLQYQLDVTDGEFSASDSCEVKVKGLIHALWQPPLIWYLIFGSAVVALVVVGLMRRRR